MITVAQDNSLTKGRHTYESGCLHEIRIPDVLHLQEVKSLLPG